MSFAMDDLLLDNLQPVQLWASDIWSHAQAFCRANHRPEHFYQDVKAKPLPGPPLMFYVAGPPCQPWARGGKQRGELDPRAPLLDKVLNTIARNRPLAFLMEESDRVASYQCGV